MPDDQKLIKEREKKDVRLVVLVTQSESDEINQAASVMDNVSDWVRTAIKEKLVRDEKLARKSS